MNNGAWSVLWRWLLLMPHPQ